MTKVDPNEMSFLDHLEDLRWHILRAIMGIVLAGVQSSVLRRIAVFL